MKRSFLLLGLLALGSVAGAADLYRWVDENGRTHVSDIVPTRYHDVATKIDTSASEIPESQRQEALVRAAREKQLVEERMRASPQPPPPVSATPKSKAVELTSPNNSDAECAELIRAYRESQECFAPFMVTRRDGRHHSRGWVRPEAYRYCQRVQSPYVKCGPPSHSPSDFPYP